MSFMKICNQNNMQAMNDFIAELDELKNKLNMNDILKHTWEVVCNKYLQEFCRRHDYS